MSHSAKPRPRRTPKLKLDKDSLRKLTEGQLGEVAGGIFSFLPPFCVTSGGEITCVGCTLLGCSNG